MKIKTIICVLLAFQLSVNAQEPKKKPSWTDSMPERDEVPGMKMPIEEEDEEDDFGLDRSSLGFDRDELSSSEDTTQEFTSQPMTNKIENQKHLDNERKKKVAQQAKKNKLEAEKLAVQKLETQKLAQKNQALQEKIVAQELEAEKLAAEKLAKQKQQEIERLVQAKREKENEQNENRDSTEKVEPIIVVEATKPPTNVIQEKPKPPVYKWKKIKNVAAVYPSKAARNKKDGWVEVQVTISPDGKVKSVHIVKSKNNTRIFDKSAIKAVRSWRYEPPSNYGISEDQTKTVRLVYQL